MKKDYERRLPTTDTFMNYKTNDIIYGFMRSESTVEPIRNEYGNVIGGSEYIPRTRIAENKRRLAELCDCSTRTIDRHIQKLLEAGLIAEPTEEEVKLMGFRYFFFPCKRGEDHYQQFSQEVLRKVVATGNTHAVRIYVHLLDQQRLRNKIKQKYVFSKADLKKRLGYNEKSASADKTIGKALEDLFDAGLIRYSKKTVYCDNGVRVSTTQKNQLDFIASKAEHLKK